MQSKISTKFLFSFSDNCLSFRGRKKGKKEKENSKKLIKFVLKFILGQT